jgi:hypothetical protein
MPTNVYNIEEIQLVDGTILEISPLKIKFLKQFMDKFDLVKKSQNDEESISILVDCVRISMKQFCPTIKTIGDVEDNVDLPTIYKIIELCAGIKMNNDTPAVEQTGIPKPKEKGDGWENLDLAKLESELFALGAWKNFEELETSISMPELMIILESVRELDYNEKKFLAAMQGVDLDEASGTKEEDPWEAMKARVASQVSGIGNGDPNDILSYQGQKAAQNGFGIGMGLEYEVIAKT